MKALPLYKLNLYFEEAKNSGVYEMCLTEIAAGLSVMNDLKNRGVKDVYVFCIDGLTGFRETINAAFPMSQIQRCIIHQIRSSTRYVSYKNIKALMADLKESLSSDQRGRSTECTA